MPEKPICPTGAVKPFSCRGGSRFLVFLLVWFALAGENPKGWIIGLPVAAVAAWCSLLFASQSAYAINPAGVLRFIPFFVKLSFLGGCDVMRRAFDPRMPMNPGLVSYQVSLPPGPPRVLLANCISLLPGTISADLSDGRILIHSIDRNIPVWAAVHLLERRVGRIFRLAAADGRRK